MRKKKKNDLILCFKNFTMMQSKNFPFYFLCFALILLAATKIKTSEPLSINSNGHSFIQGKNKNFLWLGDTGWELLKLKKEDISFYLQTRAEQGFTVIQGPVLIQFKNNELIADAYGNYPLTDKRNLETINSAYFTYVDYIVQQAAEHGLYVALVPFWAEGITQYDSVSLYNFGKELGKKYILNNNVIWVCGGEAAGKIKPELINALAKGLYAGHIGKNLMTVHPVSKASSSLGRYSSFDGINDYYYFHHETWLSFNMVNSGQHKDYPNYDLITRDVQQQPFKPVIEVGCFYEDHPDWETKDNPDAYRSQAIDVRKSAYWAIFSGAAGFTYGHHAVWQFYNQGDEAKNAIPTVNWKDALKQPGAEQIKHLSNLLHSRPFPQAFPDRTLLISNSDTANNGSRKIRIMRDGNRFFKDATFIMVYVPSSQQVKINTEAIPHKKINAWWFNPRTGVAEKMLLNSPNHGTLVIPRRADNLDWVVVIDNPQKKYPVPATKALW
jgi:hypothetical protein